MFRDAAVGDGETLLADLGARDGANISQVHLIDSGADGVEQITRVLAGLEGVDAVHIVSHGAPGRYSSAAPRFRPGVWKTTPVN